MRLREALVVCALAALVAVVFGADEQLGTDAGQPDVGAQQTDESAGKSKGKVQVPSFLVFSPDPKSDWVTISLTEPDIEGDVRIAQRVVGAVLGAGIGDAHGAASDRTFDSPSFAKKHYPKDATRKLATDASFPVPFLEPSKRELLFKTDPASSTRDLHFANARALQAILANATKGDADAVAVATGPLWTRPGDGTEQSMALTWGILQGVMGGGRASVPLTHLYGRLFKYLNSRDGRNKEGWTGPAPFGQDADSYNRFFVEVLQNRTKFETVGLGVLPGLLPLALLGGGSDIDEVSEIAEELALIAVGPSPFAVNISRFFARTMYRVAHLGESPVDAMTTVAENDMAHVPEIAQNFKLTRGWVDLAERKLASYTKAEAEEAWIAMDLISVSTMSHHETVEVLPSPTGTLRNFTYNPVVGYEAEWLLRTAIYVVMRHSQSFRRAIAFNTILGGWSSARGALIGAVLGAYAGVDGLPSELADNLAFPGRWLSVYAPKVIQARRILRKDPLYPSRPDGKSDLSLSRLRRRALLGYDLIDEDVDEPIAGADTPADPTVPDANAADIAGSVRDEL